MKRYPCIESTLDVPYHDITLRLWIDEQEVLDTYRTNVSYVKRLTDFLAQKPTRQEIVEYAKGQIKGLNAIQIKDNIGGVEHGVVAYLVEFSDVHG